MKNEAIPAEELARIESDAKTVFPFTDAMSDWSWHLEVEAYKQGAQAEYIRHNPKPHEKPLDQ